METKTRRLNTRTLYIFRTLFTVCLVSTVIFIFTNSAEIGTLSGNKSAAVTEFLNRVAGKIGVKFRFSEYLVRKVGHFLEYMLLGFCLILTLRVYTRRIVYFISWPLFGGLLTAVADEFFQLFVLGRSGEVKDVVIDFGGVLAGTIIGLFSFLLAAAVWRAFHRSR